MTTTFILMFTLIMYPLTLGILMMIMNLFISMKLMLLNINILNISIDMMFDWISMIFMSTVMMISSMIILYSTYYISKNEHNLFLPLLLMFILSMSILIISNNIFLILLGWDGLGLSSYILVIYYQNHPSAASGSITLISNRMGDTLILISMSLMMMTMNWNLSMNKNFMMIPLILLLIATCSKSAQFPFSAWLPMAMTAPTPISALVHSSTLVTAGVFILMRIMNYIHPNSTMIIMLISSATALYASMSANWEQDLKKIIALSTLSQIAMMMFAISLGSLILTFSHLIIHALFKSTMFMCAGIMIHESSYQDMRMMGMNSNNILLASSIMGISSMALMGVPFMSGFFSKDMIIENLISMKFESILTFLMIISIGMTASYTLRMIFHSNTYYFKSNPNTMNHTINNTFIPIMLMAPLAITSGTWLNWTINPDQMLYINPTYKTIIMMMLISGMMMGMLLSFKHKKYMKLGVSSISLWFNHFLSVIIMKYSSPLMMLYSNNDKSWQELYGPHKSYMLSMQLSTIPELFKKNIMMILIMMIIIPMIILL